jgi:uncharacterized protein
VFRVIALLAVLALAACGGDNEPPATAPTETAGGTVAVIDTGRGETVEVQVEVADDDAERQRGLMFRESLPDDAGMVFVFEGEQSGGFWMKDTLIPLSIAFYDKQGRILRILDMEPCRADPCRVYDPGVDYHGALEVNRGAFQQWGVQAGDRIELLEGGR